MSHVRAEAEAVGVTLTEGFFQRLERFLALIVGLLIPGAMRPVLIVLTVLGGITLLQRAGPPSRTRDDRLLEHPGR